MEEEDFYDLSSPPHVQQGDIFPDVPLISPPPDPHLVILRETDGTPWQRRPGPLLASSEHLLNAFDGVPEYAAVSVERAYAAILTQTCDLADQEQWLVCPLLIIEGTEIDLGNLMAGKYANFLGMPAHPNSYFEASYLDLATCFVIRQGSVQLKNRIASLGLGAQEALKDKLSETLTRPWGYSPGEDVPKTGKYRCIRCFPFEGLGNEIVEFQQGQKFPDCVDCAKIKKPAQCRLLRKHKRY